MSNESNRPRDIEIDRDFATAGGAVTYRKGQRIDRTSDAMLIALAERGELCHFTDAKAKPTPPLLAPVQPPTKPETKPVE